MTRRDDQILQIEVIMTPISVCDRDKIIVVTWSDGTKSLWFFNKAPKYIKELVQYYKWNGSFKVQEIISAKVTL